ncbi:uncharacterized protein CBL_02588 [Carabus blaptoides fortunei]
MSTIIDPAKLKVVELRAELSARGLDTKGNKPVLVKRLRDALEKESGTDLPDTSIVDTTTEELNTSAVSEPASPPQSKQPDKERSPELVPPSESSSEVKSTQEESESTEQVDKVPDKETPIEHSEVIEEEKMDVQESTENREMQIETVDVDKKTEQITIEETTTEDVEMKEEAENEPATTEDKEEEVKEDDSAKPETHETVEKEESASVEMVEEQKEEETGDSNNVQDNIEPEKESTEPRNRKSRWGAVSEPESQESASQPQSDCASVLGTATTPTPPQSDVELRGEKRRHSSQSPDRVSRKRSRSPIREDEPPLDNEVVQLSWFDSDLNLEISKECFTSAEPLHYEGFGYMWAGVRSTHGVNNGKVWYEVKLLENCEWNDTSLLKDPKDKEKSKESSKTDDKDREKSKDDSSKENKEDDGKDEEKPDDESETKEDRKDEEKAECQTEKDEEKMNEGQEESKDEPTPEPVHILRVGWSLPSTALQLGEEQHSYGYDSEGFAVCDSQFTEYGKKYEAGDVVGTFLDLQTDSVVITYTINGELQPAAFTIPRADLPENSTFFPHILTRNAKFSVNFGQLDEPWYKPPAELDAYTMLKDVEEKIQGRTRPEKREECEVLMMVGLPCSGKTHWTTNHVTKHPEKNYTVLGISTVLDKMKHQGKSRKDQFTGSRRTVLMDKCSRCLNKLIEVASVRRRNYILDQTNLFSSAQRRKMRPFEGFRRLAVVIVVADDEQTQREHTHQQADGKDVPDSAVLEMKASMCLPTVCDWLDEVTYAELDESKAKEIVQKYNKQGREAGYGPNYTAKHSNNQRNKSNNGDRRGQWTSNRNTTYIDRRDSRDSNRNNRWGGSGGGGSGDSRGHNRQNNWGGNRGSGNWGGRHDSRNQHHSGGGYYRNNSNNRMISGGGGGGGGGYNRNQSSGSGGGGGYNRNRNQPPHRNQMANKGGNWGNQGSGGGGGGSWNNQGNWSNQGGWGSHQSGGQSSGTGAGWSQGSWNQYSGGQTSQGGGSQQWKNNYGTQQQQYQQQQQQQQGYTQGYNAGQYTGQHYPNWNYYGQYAQGWNTQSQPSSGTSTDSASTTQYNQYTQQQQAAWAQYAQGGYSGGYGQTANQQPGNAVTGTSSTQSTTK